MKKSMHHIFSLFVIIMINISSHAQPTFLIQYRYLHAPEFDKIFQTYNTSRPWHENDIYPLTHGYSGTFGWNLRIQKAHEIHFLPEISYTRFDTRTKNLGEEINAGFHDISLGTSIRMHPKAIIKQVQNAGPMGTRFYMSLGLRYHYLKPFVRKSKEPLEWREEERYKTHATQFSTTLGAGYHLFSFGQFLFTPEISVTWYPDIELNQFAEAVNGFNTTGLLNKNDRVFTFNGGLRVTYVKKKNNWWDRPRTGDKT